MVSVGRQADGGTESIRLILFVVLAFFIFLFILVVPLFLFVLFFSLATQVVQDLVHKGFHVTRRTGRWRP